MSDGVVTATPGLVLIALAADCAPVLLWDEEAEIVGAAHAGRPGVRLNVVGATVTAMAALGARPERINALIGPAICGRDYEVPEQMRADVQAHAPGSATTTRAGTPGIDIRAGITGQLHAAGVHRIGVDARCTAEDTDLYSYRRDGPTGRHAGLIWIER